MNKVSKNPFVILFGEGYATIIARCMSKKSEKANMDPSNEIPKKPLKLVLKAVWSTMCLGCWIKRHTRHETQAESVCGKLCKDVTKQYK